MDYDIKFILILLVLISLIFILIINSINSINKYEGFDALSDISKYTNGKATAIATATLNKDGSINYIDISSSGNGYTNIPKISFNGQCSRPAKAIAIVDNKQVVAILILDSGLGYTSPPNILFDAPLVITETTQGSNEVKYNTIISELKTIESELNGNESSGSPNAANMSAMFLEGSKTPSLETLSPSQIQQKALEYENVLALQNKQNNQKVQQAKLKLIDIIKYQNKEKESAFYAKKYGLPPPPVKYSQVDIEQTKQQAQLNTTSLSLSTEQKAQCMLLLDDYNTKNEKVQDMGNMAAEQPYLAAQLQKYSTVANNAHQLYLSTCTKISTSNSNASPSQSQFQSQSQSISIGD
jgi:hypothetical protein